MNTRQLENKLALVTGASRGIGRGIAAALAAAGATVVGTATTAAGAEKISSSHENITGATLQLGEAEATDTFVSDFLSVHGCPHILVNNAGLNADNLFIRMKNEDWQKVIDVNLSATWRLIRGFSKSMFKARAGRIINISSIVASRGNIAQSNYVAAKAGIEGLTRALALEFAARQITVNAVAPGFIETDMTASLSEAVRAQMLENIPLGRFGSVEEVAEVVCFLAADSGRYITGTTLHVNGGMYMN